MANPELGAKQICPACQSKFYDLGRRPAVCPKCANSFDPEEAVRSRRMRARTVVPDYEADEEKVVKPKAEDAEGFEEEADDTPEIDQADQTTSNRSDDDTDEAKPKASAKDDLGVDFSEDDEQSDDDDDDAAPFIEDEEEDFPDEDDATPPEEDDAGR